MTDLNLNTVRCEALFASTLQRSEDADSERVQATIMATVRTLGSRGCAATVAQEFGDHPDTAIHRMLWAREVVDRMYGMDQIRLNLPPRRSRSNPVRRPERTDQTRREAGVTRAATGPA